MRKSILVLVLIGFSCATTQWISSWKNPDIVVFDAYKVLIVGMTPDQKSQEQFETRMQKQFSAFGIESMRSTDLFDVEFTHTSRTDVELDAVEDLLLERDFDAVLFTKIIGSESKQMLRQRMAGLESYYGTFRDDYLDHQEIYYDDGYYRNYTVYQAETSLYCICIGKERRLIWRGVIEMGDPMDLKKTMNEYISMVVEAMSAESVIFRAERSGPDSI